MELNAFILYIKGFVETNAIKNLITYLKLICVNHFFFFFKRMRKKKKHGNKTTQPSIKTKERATTNAINKLDLGCFYNLIFLLNVLVVS